MIRLYFALAMGLALTACGEPAPDEVPPSEPIPLLDGFAMAPVAADEDPFATHRPAFVSCPAATWGPEGGGFEVQTGGCNYAAFDQPLPLRLDAGDALVITLWYDFLDAAEPATAHVAVWVGETPIWESQVDIPARSAVIEAVALLKTTPPPDARLGLHLHNHGFNSWRFVSIDAVQH